MWLYLNYVRKNVDLCRKLTRKSVIFDAYDFLIQMEDLVVPIEVKAEGNIHFKSLKAYYDKYHCLKAIRFSTLKYVNQGWMENIPLYAVCTI